MSDTIFYSMKLKSNKTVKQAFECIQKKIKPKGVTAKWQVYVKDETLVIDFGDNVSETFVLKFENKQAEGFCKVGFPMGGELFDDEKKSEWKTFISVFHSIKKMCSEISVEDDYSIAEEYFLSLEYKFDMRGLSSDELARLDKLYNLGYHNYESFLLKIFADDTKREYTEDLKKIINPNIKLDEMFSSIGQVWETYIYETSLLKKQSLCEIYKDDVRVIDGKKSNYGDPPAEIYIFSLGLGRLFSCYDFIDNTSGRGAYVTKYFYDKFSPMFDNADEYEKCKLAYQFMVSLYDFCKYQFVGVDAINERIAAYKKMNDDIGKVYNSGVDEINNGNYENAMRYLNEALDMIPDPKHVYEINIFVESAIGDVLFAQGQYEEARTHYDNANSLMGWHYAKLSFKHGKCLYELDKQSNAKSYFKMAYDVYGEKIFEGEDPKYRNSFID